MPNFKVLSIFQIWETYQLYFSHPIYYLAIYVYKCHFSEKGYTPGYPRFPYAMSGDKISFALSPKLICKRKITFRKYLIKEMVRWNKSPKLLSWIQILQLKGSCEIQKASLYPPIFLSVLFHIYNRHNIFFFEESNQNLNQAQKAITGKYTRYKLSKKNIAIYSGQQVQTVIGYLRRTKSNLYSATFFWWKNVDYLKSLS